MTDPVHSSTENSFPGVKRGQLEATHTRAFSAMVENGLELYFFSFYRATS